MAKSKTTKSKTTTKKASAIDSLIKFQLHRRNENNGIKSLTLAGNTELGDLEIDKDKNVTLYLYGENKPKQEAKETTIDIASNVPYLEYEEMKKDGSYKGSLSQDLTKFPIEISELGYQFNFDKKKDKIVLNTDNLNEDMNYLRGEISKLKDTKKENVTEKVIEKTKVSEFPVRVKKVDTQIRYNIEKFTKESERFLTTIWLEVINVSNNDEINFDIEKDVLMTTDKPLKQNEQYAELDLLYYPGSDDPDGYFTNISTVGADIDILNGNKRGKLHLKFKNVTSPRVLVKIEQNYAS